MVEGSRVVQILSLGWFDFLHSGWLNLAIVPNIFVLFLHSDIMNQLSFHFEKLACFIVVTNFLHEIDRGPAWWELLGLIVVIILGLRRDKASIKTLFLILAVPLELLFSLTGWKGFYVISVLLCFLNMWFPDRHYALPKVPSGVGYKSFKLPEKYGSMEACMFYPCG